MEQNSELSKIINSQSNYEDEPLLNSENFRFTIKPIKQEYKILWDIYKKQQECYWTAEEIDFSKDYHHFVNLNKDEQHFIKMILAFFAASDGIVNFNLRERFVKEIMITEAQIAYGFQMMMENIHGEVYSDMLINIVKNDKERDHLFNAIKEIPSIKSMADWAFKWIESSKSIGHRVIAFAIVEGVFFSGAFASIFWLKAQRGNVSGNKELFMPGLVKSNKFIARDEGMHVNFACVLYTFVKNKVSASDVNSMMSEAVDISKDFMNNALQCKLIGMNADQMNQYIEYVADRLMCSLGYDKIYNSTNPFHFMETIGIFGKDNFFEVRPDSYQKAHNEENRGDWEFTILDGYNVEKKN